MRTYGAELFGLPDLASLAAGHHEGEDRFLMFETIFGHLRNSNTVLTAGDTMQLGNETYLRFRAAKSEEYFLESPGGLLVIERVGSG
jgi:hypothetical protein